MASTRRPYGHVWLAGAINLRLFYVSCFLPTQPLRQCPSICISTKDDGDSVTRRVILGAD